MTQRKTQQNAHTIHGVQGIFTEVKFHNDTLLSSQTWISNRRTLGKEFIRATLRFDDACKNGKHSFSITGETYTISRNNHKIEGSGGCIHDEIAKAFPELEHLIKFHLFSPDGPMHYIANTLYNAGNRDHYGLLEGQKQDILGPDRIQNWKLVVQDTDEFKLDQYFKGEEPPPPPVLKWVKWQRTGEGKQRQLDYARSSACWPEATDEELCVEPKVLKAALEARLPALRTSFHKAMDDCGFAWETKECTTS